MTIHLNISVEEWIGAQLKYNNTTHKWQLKGPMKYVLDILSKNETNFTFTLIRAKDCQWGFYANKSWTGVMGLLDRNESDLALGPIALTHERSLVSPFTSQLFSDEMSILSAYYPSDVDIFKPFFHFLDHYLFYSLLLSIFIFSVISVFENSFQTNSELSERDVMKTIELMANRFWVLMSVLLLRGNGLTQTHIIYINRNLIILISMTSLFLTTMTSALIGMSVITGPEKYNIDSLEEVLAQDIQPLLQGGSYQMQLFSSHSVELYQKIYEKLKHKSVLLRDMMSEDTVKDLIQRKVVVIDGIIHLNGISANICKSNPNLKLYFGNDLFLPTQFVLMTSKKFFALNERQFKYINRVVMDLVSSGIFDQLMAKIIDKSFKCKVCKRDYSYIMSNINAFPLTLSDVKRIYSVFMLLTILSTIVLLSEISYKKFKRFQTL